MRDKVGVYFFLEESYGTYRLNYVIKNINTGSVFIKIKKNLKKEEEGSANIEGLEHLLNNFLSLIKIDKIDSEAELSLFTNNKKIIETIKNKRFTEEYKNIQFFLGKIKEYDCKEFKKVQGFIKRESKGSMKLYLECKKAGKEYRKLLKRSSTLPIMRRKVLASDYIVFFDFEMNCLIDFKSVEIVSIGACKLNLKTKAVDKYYSLVKPLLVSELTEKCVEITGLIQEEIDEAKSFNEVFKEVSEWVGDSKTTYMYWGGNDISVLKNDYKRNGEAIDFPLEIIENNIDFQEVLCKDVLEKEDMLSLTNGLIEYEIDFEGHQHNALDDAYNLYKLYMKTQMEN